MTFEELEKELNKLRLSEEIKFWFNDFRWEDIKKLSFDQANSLRRSAILAIECDAYCI